MRPRPLIWLSVSVLCFVGAFYFWRLGNLRAARRSAPPLTQKSEVRSQKSEVSASAARPFQLLSQPGNLNSLPITNVLTAQAARNTNRFALRLSNTTSRIGQLLRNDRALLLENALLDTTRPAPAIPDNLRAQGDPGSYIVQARGPIDNAFRALLQAAGASIVSYIPNNAYLVRASEAVAQELQAAPLVQAVLPYEPYYKLKPSLLKLAVAQDPLPAGSVLNVLLFADTGDTTRAQMQNLGATVLGGPAPSPFGPVLTVRPAADSLSALAGLPGVQEVEWSSARAPANDLSRARIEVSTDTLVTTNYLGLTGTNVLVNVNDSGVDATHPDLKPRVFGNSTNVLVDPNGHGTHVAGIIASSGANSLKPPGPVGVGAVASGSISNASFRGKAPAANLFVQPVGMDILFSDIGNTATWPSDAALQQGAAQTNAFISNNSWNYVGGDSQTYDLHAASYDAAVRDALPNVTGSQPLLLVFSAGDSGGGNDDGTGGNADSMQSPATAKNVITVGAIEQPRNITNNVWVCTLANGTNTCVTNQPWLGMTDSSNEVASFSSRGNVGIGVEGDYGRFKPDVVAPGTFVVSTRSGQWDTNAYYNPTSHIYYVYQDLLVGATNVWDNVIFVPDNAVQMNLTVVPNTNSPVPFPDLLVYVNQVFAPTNIASSTVVGTNSVSLPPDAPLSPINAYWFYGIGNLTTQDVAFDLITDLVVTNNLGNYLQVLAGLNDSLGPYYRYESGTSMAAADASGTLALMQEFFESRLGLTNHSPALFKALLINGARTVSAQYDFNTQAPVNSQGWGLINLPTTLPGGLTNRTAGTNSIFFIDQSPTNALATGQSQTRYVSLTSAAQTQPLRITLVWTDPPGNPIVSAKLVNNLDLIVTNLSTGDVFFGNDIVAGTEFNVPWNTNTVPNLDTVNNVENVYLSPRLGTNYSVTVVGRRVNVNAVTAQTNNVCQDYALVISSGDGLITNALSVTTSPMVFLTQPLVTVMTNSFVAGSGFEGGFLFNQRVGASTELQGTNTIPVTNGANAFITVGMTNQWHFYVVTNTTSYTNAAFLTFLPANLAVPRMGVFADSADAATRPQADIDLFVAPPAVPNNWALTNLDTNVLIAANKSLGRGGTEMIVYSNATPGVYYIGVQSEDQMAAEYALLGVFSQQPFGSTDANGNQSLVGIPAPAPIPDAYVDASGITISGSATIVCLAVQPIKVHRVIVTNNITHELMGDLLGTLTLNGASPVVLNNHSPDSAVVNQTYIYDDSQEHNVLNSVPVDGPGSLMSFAGQQGAGAWMLTEVDSAPSHVGTNNYLNLFLERQQDPTHGIIATIQPGSCREDFVDVPTDATSLTVEISILSATPPIDVTLDVCPASGAACASTVITNALGGSVTINQFTIPPLQVGTDAYSIRTCNLSGTPITVKILAVIGFSLSTTTPVVTAQTTVPVPILDDAVTDIYLTNNLHEILSSLDVGLLISDPRISDLSITLISPNGTRILLFEDRGGSSTNGLGTFSLTTNYFMVPFATNDFDLAPVGLYAAGSMFQGWNVLSNFVEVLDDYTCLCLSNHILALLDGAVSNTLPTTNSLPTNSIPYTFSYRVNHLPWLEGMVTWWPLDTDGSDIFGGFNGLLQGDVVFSTGQSVPFFDDFAGPALNPVWEAYLPSTGNGGSATSIEDYAGAPNYSFGTLGANSILLLTNNLSSQQRVGWRSGTAYYGQSFRYEVRFNTLTQGGGSSTNGPIEIWMFDALDPSRYDVISPGNNGSSRVVLAGSSIDNAYNTLTTFSYADNTWYHLVLTGAPGQNVRASVFDDAGNELVGQSFAHDPSAFSTGLRIGLSQFVTATATNAPVDVAVDWARLTTVLSGEVNQAYFGDGLATRMMVPRCTALDLGLGRGFSIEGWIWPANVTNSPNVPNVGPVTVTVPSYYNWSGWPYNGANLWFDTGIDVAAGQILTIAATGWVTFGGGVACGPDGTNYNGANFSSYAIFPSTQLSSLIGKIGGTTGVGTGTPVPEGTAGKGPGFVGSSYRQVIHQSGRLFLTVNDQIWFYDNSGTFSATVMVETPSSATPLVEWNDPTNVSPQGVQLWLAGLPGTNAPGALWANIWDTNLQPHFIGTVTNAITNGGWQHVALTYDTNSLTAVLYTNGQQAAAVKFPTGFVPRTYSDVYLGFDPATNAAPISYSNFSSTAGLNLVGSAAQNGNVLRLTPAALNQYGYAWALNKQPCAAGFSTSFQFQIGNAGITYPHGDGIEFTVQTNGPTDGNAFQAPNGAEGGQVSVFFNTYWNSDPYPPPSQGDVSGNSVGIIVNTNYVAQANINSPILTDGAVHSVQIFYDGAAFTVSLDGVTVLTNVPVPGLGGAVDANGKAWVGFAAGCGGGGDENQDIVSWTFSAPTLGTSYAGGLDEFSVYERALTPCEVNAIFNAGSRGKYGTNVLVCPVVTEVTLFTSATNQVYTFTNGLSWTNAGPFWETNTINFSVPTNTPTPIIVRGRNPYDPSDTNAANNLNAVVDDFVLSELVPETINGMLYFTDDTNLATIPIKFAPTPYTTSNFPPVLIFSNDFRRATPGVYQIGATIPGGTNSLAIGTRDWTVFNGPVTVISNAMLDAVMTNCLAMATGGVQCLLPTIPGQRYQLTYKLRGPCAVGWWNGSLDSLSQRALDLISGNNGAFINGATNTTAAFAGDISRAFVGTNGFFFIGQVEPTIDDPDIWPEDIDDPSSQIELADPPQLQFTNAFTIEGWIKPITPTNTTYCGTEQIFFRGYPEPLDCRGLGDPYWLALEPTADPTRYDLHFHIAEAHTGTVGADALTTNGPVQLGGGSNSGWWHIAAVFDKPFTNIMVVTNGTNVITITTNSMRLYLNGTLIASNYTTLSPYQTLDPALSPGATIGERCGYDWTQPFSGYMDEITLYARALTDPEIYAIAAAGTAGKADFNAPLAQSLARINVAVDGVSLGFAYGDNSTWSTQTVEFSAVDTNAIVTLQSVLPGTLLEGITLSEVPSELYYLPEVPLSDLYGEDAYGVWTLEIVDTRTGPTTNSAQLIEWQLNFGLAPSNPPPVIYLSHGIPYTNTLVASGVQYFVVDVPQWATMATNILGFADQYQTANPLPVTVFFSPTNFPAPTNLALIGPLVSQGINILTTNSTPPLLTNQPYYLAVTNPNPVSVTFALGVWFDITTLTNCQMLVSNVVGPAGIPRYYQFDVPPDNVPPGYTPGAVSFWLSDAQCNLKVVLSEHLPLPDLDHYDYISQQPCTNDQVVMLVTNTTPFPIQTNRWYVGVFNTGPSNTTFSVEACCTNGYPLIIPLTNDIPFVVPLTNSPYAAPPGPPQWVFFEFVITNAVPGVLFELYNLSGNADLVLQQDVPPTMPPYFAASSFTSTNSEQIVLRTSPSLPATATVPDLRGLWYLGVYNNDPGYVAYTIRAVLPGDDGLLTSALPLDTQFALLPPPNGLLISWNSVVGERYVILYAPSLSSPVGWSQVGQVTATTTLSTFEVLPAPTCANCFQVVQVLNLQPTLDIQLGPTNTVRISWSTAYPGYTLQDGPSVFGPWSNVTFPPATGVFVEGNEFVVYDPLGSAVKFYRLIK